MHRHQGPGHERLRHRFREVHHRVAALRPVIFGEPYSPQDRAERIIAGGRVLLAVVSLAGVWLAPADLALHRSYWFLVGYSAYATALAIAVWRVHRPMTRLRHSNGRASFA